MAAEPLLLQETKTRLGVNLSQRELAALRAAYPSLQVAPSAQVSGAFNLTPGSLIGTIVLGDRQVIIQPKLEISQVFFLLAYASRLTTWMDDLARLDPTASLLEAIIPIYCAHLQRAFRRGLLQGYRHVDEALMTIRGRIDFRTNVNKRFGLVPPIDVSYDDFTADIEENRLLKAATRALGRLAISAETARRALRRYVFQMAEITDVDYRANVFPDFNFNRLNAHYQPALTLAELILSSMSLDLRVGDQVVTGFLIDMNKVFEEFVRTALRDALRVDSKRFPRRKGVGLRLDTRDRITLEPDLSLWRGARCVFVGDAKYKVTRDGLGPNSDIYQLLAYVVATGLAQGTLIYAKGEADPADHRVRFLGRTLFVRAVDLTLPPSDLLGQIADIARDIEEAALRAA